MTTSYEKELDLGKVPLGHAWVARDKSTNQPVVVKRIPLEAIGGGGNGWTHLVEETRLLTRIDHRNIASTLEVGEDGDHLVMVTLRPGGRMLSDIVEESRRITIRELRDWILPVVEGLTIAHDSGVIHRHVHERLIVVTDDGTAVLTGFALTLDQRVDPDPIPPELLNGGKASPESDQFLVGAMLQRFSRFTDAVPALDIIISRAMQPDAGRRFPDLMEMHQALDAVLHRAAAEGADADKIEPENGVLPSASRVEPDSLILIEPPIEGISVIQDLHKPVRTMRRRRFLGPAVAAAMIGAVSLAWFFTSRDDGVDASISPLPVVERRTTGPMAEVRDLLAEGRVEEASAELEILIGGGRLQDPTPALDALGTIRLQEGRGGEAVDLFERALGRRAAESLYYKLSLAQASVGRDQQAIRTVDEGLRLYPESKRLREARFHLGGA